MLKRPIFGSRLTQAMLLGICAAIVISAQQLALAQLGSGKIEGVDWNNNGSKIAIGHDTGLVEVMNSSTGQLLQSFQLADTIIDLIWNPQNSDLLAVSAAELDGPGTIHILNTATGQELLTLTDGDHINSISWSPDGSHIAGAIGFSADPISFRYVTIWNATTGQIIRDIPFYPVEILSLDWSPDGSQIVAGGGDNNVTIWDANTGTVVHTLIGHTSAVLEVAWSPDGTKVATSSSIDDRTVRVWNASTGQSLVVISSGAFDISWSPDGAYIAAADLDPEILIWDVATGQLMETISQPNDVQAIAWSPDGTKLVFGDDSGNTQIDPISVTPNTITLQINVGSDDVNELDATLSPSQTT